MKYRFLILTILCSLLLAGCKNSFLQKDSSEFVKVTITLNDNSRKLAPDSNKLNDFFNNLTYTLKVGDAAEGITLNDCYDGTYSCEVQTGTYDLVLNAYDGSALIFSDRKEKVNLQEDVLLTFDLKITEDSAPGCLSYYFSPVDFGSLDDNKLEKISDFTLTLNGDEYNYNGFVKFDEEKDCYYFEIAGLPAGAYSMTLKYTFYRKEDYKIEEAVLIYPGFETTNDGNEFYYSKVYTITYHTDADIQNFCAKDENFPKKYNPNDFIEIGSPLTGSAADEYIFLGWYYDEDFTKPLYKYYQNGEELYNFGEDTKVAGNIVLYSKIKRAVEIEYVVLDSEGNNFEDICDTKDYNLWRNNGRDRFIFNSINYGSINITEDDEISYKNYKSSICDENKNIYNFVDIYSQLEIHGDGDGELIPYYIENWYYDSSFNNPVNFVEFTDYFFDNTHRLIDTEKFLSKVEGTKLTLYAKVIDLYNLLVYEDGSEKPEVDDFIVPEYDFESKKLCFRYDLYPVADYAEKESISFYYSDKECKNMLPYEFYNGAVGFYYSTYDIVDEDISIYSKTIPLNDNTEVLKIIVNEIPTPFNHNDTFLGTKINIADPDIGDDETFIGWFYDEECTKELENEIKYNNEFYDYEKKSYITLTPNNFQSEITIYPKIIPNIKINYVLSDGTKIAKREDITQNVIDNFNNISSDFKEAIFVIKFNYDIDPYIKDKTNFFKLPILTDEYNGKIFDRWYTDAEFKTTDNIVINNDQYCLAVDENNCKKDGYTIYAKYVYPLSIKLSGYKDEDIKDWKDNHVEEYDKLTNDKFKPSDTFKLPQFNETENALEGWYISTINPEGYDIDDYFELEDVKEFNKEKLYYQIPSEYFSLTESNITVYITPKFKKGTVVALYNTDEWSEEYIWVTARDSVDNDSKHFEVEKTYGFNKDLVLTPEGNLFYTVYKDSTIKIYKDDSEYIGLGDVENILLSYDDNKNILWYMYYLNSNWYLNGINVNNDEYIYTEVPESVEIQLDCIPNTFVVSSENNVLYYIYSDDDSYYPEYFLKIIDLGKNENIYEASLDLWLLGKDFDSYFLKFTDMYLYKNCIYIIFNYGQYGAVQSRGGIIQFNLDNYKCNRKITGWVSTPDTQVIHPSGYEDKVFYFPASIDSKDLFGPQKIIGYKDDKQKLLIADNGLFYFTDEDGDNYYKEINRVVEFDLENNEIASVRLIDNISFNSPEFSGCYFSSAD